MYTVSTVYTYNEGRCTLVNLTVAVTAFVLHCTLQKMHYKMYIEEYAFHQLHMSCNLSLHSITLHQAETERELGVSEGGLDGGTV